MSFVLFVCPPVCMEKLGSHCTAFHEILQSNIFRKSVHKIQVSLKSDKNNEYCTWRPIYIFFITSRSVFLRLRNVSDKSFREHQDTHFMFNNFFFFRKSCLLWDNLKKYCTAGQAKLKYGARALHGGNLDYKHTLRLCKTYCFSAATMVARTLLIVTLHVHCLYCFLKSVQRLLFQKIYFFSSALRRKIKNYLEK